MELQNTTILQIFYKRQGQTKKVMMISLHLKDSKMILDFLRNEKYLLPFAIKYCFKTC